MTATTTSRLPLIVFALLVFLAGPAAIAMSTMLCEQEVERVEESRSEVLIELRSERPGAAERFDVGRRAVPSTPPICRCEAPPVTRTPGSFLVPLRC